MKNHVQRGDNLTIPAPATVVSGEVVIAGEIIGIAAESAGSGKPVDLVTGEVFELAKVSGNAFSLGAAVYYDAGTKLCTTTTSGNTKIGTAVAVAGSGTGTVKVRLLRF